MTNTAKEGIYLNKSKEERKSKLEAGCEKIEPCSYQKEFTKSEMTEIREETTNTLIQHSDLDDELTEIKAVFKEKMNPLKQVIKKNTEFLKYGSRLVMEDCYKYIDREQGLVMYYNEDGLNVLRRPASPEEMQLTMKL